MSFTGVDPGFQVRGATLKKKFADRSEIFWGISCEKNHDFMLKNIKKACPPWIRP